jgi:hypothetical protein
MSWKTRRLRNQWRDDQDRSTIYPLEQEKNVRNVFVAIACMLFLAAFASVLKESYHYLSRADIGGVPGTNREAPGIQDVAALVAVDSAATGVAVGSLATPTRRISPAPAADVPRPEPYPGVMLRSIDERDIRVLKLAWKQRILVLDVSVQSTDVPPGADTHIPFVQAAVDCHRGGNNNDEVVLNASFDSELDQALFARDLSSDDPIIVIGSNGKWTWQASEHLAEIGYGTIFVVVSNIDRHDSLAKCVQTAGPRAIAYN